MEKSGENMGAIYRIYNTETRQSYIGQSDRPYYRISQHLTPSGSNASPAIQAALPNHPPESWQWEIVADKKDYPRVSLNDLECLFIDLYGSRVHGYNIKRGGGVSPCGDTQDETKFRKGMRDKIVRAISDYRKEQGGFQLNWLVLAEADLPDSYYIEATEYRIFGPDVQNLEDVKRKIEEAQFVDKVEKACEQLTDLLSTKADKIVDLLKPTLDIIPEDLQPYFFVQLLIQREVQNAEVGEEVGSWSITPKVLTLFDYQDA